MQVFSVASRLALCAGVLVAFAPLQGSILSTVHLDSGTLRAFEQYVAQFDRDVAAAFAQSGKMWLDGASCCARNPAFLAGKPVVEPRENKDIAGGSIHHFSGVMHINGGTIENVRHIMQDYGNYPKYFKGDVVKGAGNLNADSTPTDEHYTSHISIAQSTLWLGVAYDCIYDTHYLRFDPHHWESKSSAASIKEWRNPKDVSQGYFPEGDDHGFVWKTNTFWFVRENNGGVDVQLDSMTLSRTIPVGFAWWGTKRTHDAVDKMLRDMKTAVDALH